MHAVKLISGILCVGASVAGAGFARAAGVLIGCGLSVMLASGCGTSSEGGSLGSYDNLEPGESQAAAEGNKAGSTDETTQIIPTDSNSVEDADASDGKPAADTVDKTSSQPTVPSADVAFNEAVNEPVKRSEGGPQASIARPGDAVKPDRASTSDTASESAVGRPADGSVKPLPGDPANGEKPAAEESVVDREIKLLVADRDFKAEGPEGAIRISYDDIDLLKVLNMEPVPTDAEKHFPDWLKDLDGKRVRLRGFMYPPFLMEGIRSFFFARDNQICCFGRNPKIYDLFPVSMRDGVTTHYIQNRPFDVVGVFRISFEELDGKLVKIYEIDDAIVIEK